MPYSNKMQTTTFRWFLNIILAGIIFSNAESGRLLGIQSLPLQFSAVWPATGFSLTALLLFGYRAWPGVFAGNFVYNFLHLYYLNPSFIGPIAAATMISLGSLSQALLGTYIMRHFSSAGYFKTIKDIVIFLLGGGLLTCMIAATVGVATFYLYGVLTLKDLPYTWLTFWSGDCMGVYIFTPLLIVWSLSKLPVKRHDFEKDALLMGLAFIALSLLFFYVNNYPVAYLFIPYSIWAALRFGFRGATAAILFLSVMAITVTTFGHGSFIYTYPISPLLILVMFLETTVTTALLFAATRVEKREDV